jgi:hypothetical protein
MAKFLIPRNALCIRILQDITGQIRHKVLLTIQCIHLDLVLVLADVTTNCLQKFGYINFQRQELLTYTINGTFDILVLNLLTELETLDKGRSSSHIRLMALSISWYSTF